jgi:hypothetical protein
MSSIGPSPHALSRNCEYDRTSWSFTSAGSRVSAAAAGRMFHKLTQRQRNFAMTVHY